MYVSMFALYLYMMIMVEKQGKRVKNSNMANATIQHLNVQLYKKQPIQCSENHEGF
eukprot:c45348_g1_i1 orf=77-244(+)